MNHPSWVAVQTMTEKEVHPEEIAADREPQSKKWGAAKESELQRTDPHHLPTGTTCGEGAGDSEGGGMCLGGSQGVLP